MDIDSIKSQIEKLTIAKESASSFDERLGLHDQIHTLQMELDGVAPSGHNPIECIGCGS
jgi:hypothetical protein